MKGVTGYSCPNSKRDALIREDTLYVYCIYARHVRQRWNTTDIRHSKDPTGRQQPGRNFLRFCQIYWSNRCVPRSTFTYACIAERTTTGVMTMASEEKHVRITLLLMCPPEYRWIMCIGILLSTVANGRRFNPIRGRNFLFKPGSLDIGHRA